MKPVTLPIKLVLYIMKMLLFNLIMLTSTRGYIMDSLLRSLSVLQCSYSKPV